ncbi:DUF4214 domain-containing protein [Frigidibacter mobilis]|nr:DUF4214 domain-containing protein [Frigidibacter mobilis]
MDEIMTCGPRYGATRSDKNWADENTSGGDKDHPKAHETGKDKYGYDTPSKQDTKPIILDLDGDGIEITDLTKSTQFQADDEGLKHRTAWAGAGDGVLFIDADGNGAISDLREYVFTEWDPASGDDMEALRRVFDTNGDGKLTSADARFAEFRVLVTGADGSTSTKTLAQLGITAIDLRADATKVVLQDGSQITGQTTFVMGGITRTAANVTLMAERQGYRLTEVVSTDGAGNRVVVQTGYATGGDKAFIIRSVTSPDGLSIDNSFDDDGDGVFDRLQSIDTVINANSSRTETVTNLVGSDSASAVLASRIETTTSADGKQVTILTDSQGGGWFDRSEVRTTATNGSRTVTISDLARDGSVIQSSSETISVNGLTRTQSLDRNGDGDGDLIVTETILVAQNGTRTETVALSNQNGSARSSTTEVTSGNGQNKTTTHDLDGDGAWDLQVAEQTTRPVGGGIVSNVEARNADGTLHSRSVSTVSADGLTTSTQIDVDGDGTFDGLQQDVTVITTAGVRTNTVTTTNADGSINRAMKTVLGADKISGEVWNDLGQDGTFDATDLLQSVVVNAGNRIKTDWQRNADGSINARSVEATNSSGTTTTTTADLDGDGDTDRKVVDQTTVNGTSTRTITATNQDGSRYSRDVITTSADGLTVTRVSDLGGSTANDVKIVEKLASTTGGSRTQTTETFAGNGTTLTGKATVVESADRLTSTQTLDNNGDGANDRVISSVEGLDGSKTVTDTTYFADGGLASRLESSVSANGLSITTAQDVNGDQIDDQVFVDETLLAADGSTVRTVSTYHGDGGLGSSTTTTISDDGLMTTAQIDADGDGGYERTVTATTAILANGARATTTVTTSESGAALSRSMNSTNDNGLISTVASDADGDGDYDLTTIATTSLLADGGRETLTETRYLDGTLRAQMAESTNDNGRQAFRLEDVNGDGIWDRSTSRIVADDGTITQTISEFDVAGALLSNREEQASGNGLTRTTRTDFDGDGLFDRISDQARVLNADGSQTTTTINLSTDGSLISQSTQTVSDDGWVSSTSADIDGDGTAEFVTTTSYSLGSSGVETETSKRFSEDGTLLSSDVVITAADRDTVTRTVDLDGNGLNDRRIETIRQADGAVVQTSSFYSVGGGLEATSVVSVSGDGLSRTERRDQNGDGRYELVGTATTELGADGSVSTLTAWRTDRYVTLAQSRTETSGDKNSVRTELDSDGDGYFETRGETLRTFEADGRTRVVQTGFDAAALKTGEISQVTSGDGLRSETSVDYAGDGGVDRTRASEAKADGAWILEERSYLTTGQLASTVVSQSSADGRFVEITSDLDGDGRRDRLQTMEIDLSRNETSIWEDYAASGEMVARIVQTDSANGTGSTWQLDVDGDGDVDIERSAETAYDGDGTVVTQITERVTPYGQEYGAGRISYSEETRASADGLQVTTTYDIDGDGIEDGSRTIATEVTAKGATITTDATTYSDGSLRSYERTETSADARTVKVSSDYDGNGIADITIETRIGADGSLSEMKTAFNEAGVKGQVFLTTTSADGLTSTIQRRDATQTITRSALDDGSYTFDNGLTPDTDTTKVTTSHRIDALGIEAWDCTLSWTAMVTTIDEEGRRQTREVSQTQTASARIDAAAKAQMLDEAARIYDAVLDRDMDYQEIETLVLYVGNGRLDKDALATSLVGSSEFSTRYGSLTNAEFLTQIYMNTLQRAPSLGELDGDLRALAGGQLTRAGLATQLAESAEHLVVGNGHLATNNFDVIINPAVYERSLDKSWAEKVVKSLVDVAYDRDATAQELKVLSAKLLDDTSNPDDLAAMLLALSGDAPGVASNSLKGLSGAALVKQAYVNAFGRQPTASEQQTWEENLSSGRISSAQFVASLAMSVEHDGAGNSHVATGIPVVNMVNGSASANNIIGTVNADYIVGGGGNDTINGGKGSDTYVWHRGDGSDRISDSGDSNLETDRLVLADVNSGDVVFGYSPLSLSRTDMEARSISFLLL